MQNEKKRYLREARSLLWNLRSFVLVHRELDWRLAFHDSKTWNEFRSSVSITKNTFGKEFFVILTALDNIWNIYKKSWNSWGSYLLLDTQDFRFFSIPKRKRQKNKVKKNWKNSYLKSVERVLGNRGMNRQDPPHWFAVRHNPGLNVTLVFMYNHFSSLVKNLKVEKISSRKKLL